MDPNHIANGWTESCDRCHIPTAWRGAAFNHNTFPLTGQHRTADCSECHVNNVYVGTPRECVDCHRQEYLDTTDPGHVASGFPEDCQQCHTTSGWGGAFFNHSTYPLTGRHATADCAQCHVNNVYAGTPRDCVECHRQEYLNTNDPNHVSAGFPETCQQCHNTSDWDDASFNHTFPINSGDHRNFDCMECHQTPSNYLMVSCTHCHDHRQSEMDDEHDDVSNYVWSSPACVNCHPDGRADD